MYNILPLSCKPQYPIELFNNKFFVKYFVSGYGYGYQVPGLQ